MKNLVLWNDCEIIHQFHNIKGYISKSLIPNIPLLANVIFEFKQKKNLILIGNFNTRKIVNFQLLLRSFSFTFDLFFF